MVYCENESEDDIMNYWINRLIEGSIAMHVNCDSEIMNDVYVYLTVAVFSFAILGILYCYMRALCDYIHEHRTGSEQVT